MNRWVKPNCFALLRKEVVCAYKNGWNYLNDPLSAHFNYIDGRITRGQYFMSTCCLLWGQFFKFLLLDSYINLWVKFHFQIHKGKFVGHGRLYSLYSFVFCSCFVLVLFFFFFFFLFVFVSYLQNGMFLFYIQYVHLYIFISLHMKELCGYLHIDARILFYKPGNLNSYAKLSLSNIGFEQIFLWKYFRIR